MSKLITISKAFAILCMLLIVLNCNKQVRRESYIVWGIAKYPNNLTVETEWYYGENKDSATNQQKIIRDGIIDTLNSHFYDFSIISSKNGTDFTGSIYFYSSLDTTKNIINKEVKFFFMQENKDSLFYKEYTFGKNSNHVTFDYVTIRDQMITGYISELLTVKTSNKEKVRIIERYTLVDNRPDNRNPRFGLDK